MSQSILIVDDEEGIRDSLSSILREEGYLVDAVSSGEECLERLANQQMDLVLLDVWLPKMDGLEFIDKVNGLPWRPPVILLTGHASMDSAIEGLGKGAFDYVTKPINFVELGVLSDRAIQVHRMEESYRLPLVLCYLEGRPRDQADELLSDGAS